jgi:flagellar hook-associated protein FlgK
MIDSVTGSGLSAVYKGQETAVSAANKIARAGTTAETDSTRDITEGVVELKQAEHLVKAGAKVIQAADDMIGSLFDERA